MPAVGHDRPVVAEIARELLADVEQVAQELSTRICAEIEVYGAGGLVEQDELVAALHAQIRHVMGQLSGQWSMDSPVPDEIGRRRAERDVPLPEVLRAYRMGFAGAWERMVQAAERRGGRAVEELLEASIDIWQLADDFSSRVTTVYRTTISERMLAADRRRSGLLAALLDGSSAHSVWEIARLLGLPYEGTFLVLVARVDHLAASPMPTMDEQLRALGVVSAWRSQPEHEIGLLCLTRQTQSEAVVALLEKIAAGPVGLSPVFPELGATPGALRLAQVAVEALPAHTPAVRQLPDEARTDLLVRDRDATRVFVRRVLGPVLGLPEEERSTLLSTVTAWIDAHGSAVEAGRALYCHENTVRYRLRRLEDHLGVSLDEPRRLSDLVTALAAIEAFPELSAGAPSAGGAGPGADERTRPGADHRLRRGALGPVRGGGASLVRRRQARP